MLLLLLTTTKANQYCQGKRCLNETKWIIISLYIISDTFQHHNDLRWASWMNGEINQNRHRKQTQEVYWSNEKWVEWSMNNCVLYTRGIGDQFELWWTCNFVRNHHHNHHQHDHDMNRERERTQSGRLNIIVMLWFQLIFKIDRFPSFEKEKVMPSVCVCVCVRI